MTVGASKPLSVVPPVAEVDDASTGGVGGHVRKRQVFALSRGVVTV